MILTDNKGRYVKITQSKDILSLAEVQVYGGDSKVAASKLTMLSEGKPTKLPRAKHGHGLAEHGVDGNMDGLWGGRSIFRIQSHPKQPTYWEVDLLDSYKIHMIIIHNILEKPHQHYIDQAKVKIDGKTVATINFLMNVNTYPLNIGGVTGRRVRVRCRNKEWCPFLSLAEVQVLGEGGAKPPGSNIGSSSYMNLLSQNKFATQSAVKHDGHPMKAVDGLTSGEWGRKTSIYTGGQPRQSWWKVDLKTAYRINLIVIHNRIDGGERQWIDQTEVYAGETKCDSVTYKEHQHVYYVGCGGASADYVKLVNRKSNFLCISEVQVFGGSKSVSDMLLVSPGKQVTMSVADQNGRAERAIDGYTQGYWNRHKCCTLTKSGMDNFLQIDLKNKYPIYLILVHNRMDKCCDRWIHGAKVLLDGKSCGTIKYVRNMKVYPITCEGRKGQVVRIEQKNRKLSLAEVQVFASTTGLGDIIPYGHKFIDQTPGQYFRLK